MFERVFEQLKIRDEKVYTIETSGINPLVFDSKHSVWLKFMESILDPSDPTGYLLHHLELREDVYNLESQVTEREYDRLICPVYMLDAQYDDWEDNTRSLHGVIRPVISKHLVEPILHSNLPPEFHFYLEGSGTPQTNYIGKSANFPQHTRHLYTDVMREPDSQRRTGSIAPSYWVNPFPERIIVFF